MLRRLPLMLLALLALLLTPAFVAAQTTSTVTTSGFQVQNLNQTQPATISIQYIDATTQQQVGSAQTATIPAGGSLTFVTFAASGFVQMSAPAGFRGSVVISSDQPIVAVTNVLGASNALGDSYNGFTAGANTLDLPLIVRGNFGVDTSITVQNVGTAPATVNIAYTPGFAGNSGVTEPAFTLQPGASRTIYQKDNAALGSFTGSAPGFVGSATVTATGSQIVATVLQEGNGQILAYNGFLTGTGSPTVALPLILGNNFGAYTGIQILNAGSQQTVATVAFSPNTVTAPIAGLTPCATPPNRQITIDPGKTGTLLQTAGAAAPFDAFFNGCIYIGGATVSSSNGQNLLATVNQVNNTSKDASTYAGFNPATATNKVQAPLVYANNFGAISGVQVQNVSGSPTTVTISYGPNTYSGAPPAGLSLCGTPTARSRTLQPNEAFTFLQTYIAGQPAGLSAIGSDSQFQSCMYVGAATITADGSGQIVAIVNQANPGPASNDKLFTYGAFRQ
ncbi:MAG: hypothetical protein HXY39_14490 [Chloroflexi bacterium]|nr:hypothetical protein [Chloroflexota bacterium]